jgi:choline transport protein
LHSDCVSHLAEEIPNPRTNIPKAILAQYTVGFLTALIYLIAIFYAVSDLTTLFEAPYASPLAELYHQATSSRAGALGLVIAIFAPTLGACVGCYITAGRMLWTLGRDGATPFKMWVGHIDARWRNPWNATVTCGALCTALGVIYVGSTTAFNAFVGSFVVLSSLSYLAFLLPNLVTRRRHIRPGPFHMSDVVYYVVAGGACMYMIVFMVVYCFPYAVPFDAVSMNYSSLITGGLSLFVGGWWVWVRGRGYEGYRGAAMLVICEDVG